MCGRFICVKWAKGFLDLNFNEEIIGKKSNFQESGSNLAYFKVYLDIENKPTASIYPTYFMTGTYK